MCALSNAGPELERRLTQFGRFHLFDDVVNSYRVRIAKPDEAIFHHSPALIGFPPDQVLFIDDKLRNTSVADTLGFHIYVYPDLASFMDGARILPSRGLSKARADR